MTNYRGISQRDVAFTLQLQELSSQISRCSTIASVLMILAAVLWVASSRYEPLLLLVPAVLMMVVAELKLDRMRQSVIAYLQEFGVDVSDAPKPLFHSLRRLFGGP